MDSNFFLKSYKLNILYYKWGAIDTAIKQAFVIFNLAETVGSLRNRVWETYRTQKVYRALSARYKHYPLEQQSKIIDSALKQVKFPANSWFVSQDSEVICWLSSEIASDVRLDWNLPLSVLFGDQFELTLYMADCSTLQSTEPEPQLSTPQPTVPNTFTQFRNIPIVQNTNLVQTTPLVYNTPLVHQQSQAGLSSSQANQRLPNPANKIKTYYLTAAI